MRCWVSLGLLFSHPSLTAAARQGVSLVLLFSHPSLTAAARQDAWEYIRHRAGGWLRRGPGGWALGGSDTAGRLGELLAVGSEEGEGVGVGCRACNGVPPMQQCQSFDAVCHAWNTRACESMSCMLQLSNLRALPRRRYDVVWVQWALLYLTDGDAALRARRLAAFPAHDGAHVSGCQHHGLLPAFNYCQRASAGIALPRATCEHHVPTSPLANQPHLPATSSLPLSAQMMPSPSSSGASPTSSRGGCCL